MMPVPRKIVDLESIAVGAFFWMCVVFFAFIGWLLFRNKKNKYGGRELRLKRTIAIQALTHYTVLLVVYHFTWLAFNLPRPLWHYTGHILAPVLSFMAALPTVSVWWHNIVLYSALAAAFFFMLNVLVKPAAYYAKPVSARKVAKYMKRGAVILPTAYQRFRDIYKRGLTIPLEDLFGGFFYQGNPKTGKTHLAMTFYYYLSILFSGPDTVHIIFDCKRDWLTHFYRPGDIILGYGKPVDAWATTHVCNLFYEVVDASDFKGLAHDLFPYHQFADRIWVDGERALFEAVCKALYRKAQRENLEMSNEDILKAFRLSERELAAFLKQYEEDNDMNTAIDYLIGEKARTTGGSIVMSMKTELECVFAGEFAKSGGKPAVSIKEYVANPKGRRLFIRYDEEHGLEMIPVFRLLFDLAAKYSFGDKKRYKFFINDELSLTPHLQRLDRMHNVGRDYKITSLSCLQSKSQLNADYGKDRADAILAGYRYKWFFSSIDPAARDYAKRVLGTEQEIVEDEKLGKMPRIYHLYTDREWRTLEKGACVVITPAGDNLLAFYPFEVNKKLFDEAAKIYYEWCSKKLKKQKKKRVDKNGK